MSGGGLAAVGCCLMHGWVEDCFLCMLRTLPILPPPPLASLIHLRCCRCRARLTWCALTPPRCRCQTLTQAW
jgi:hypothetical protein